jgi:hypothetical protein
MSLDVNWNDLLFETAMWISEKYPECEKDVIELCLKASVGLCDRYREFYHIENVWGKIIKLLCDIGVIGEKVSEPRRDKKGISTTSTVISSGQRRRSGKIQASSGSI